MKRTVLVISILLSGLMLTSAYADCCVEVELVVEPSAQAETLKMRLINRSAEVLSIRRSALPWGDRYSMILVAVHEEQPNRQIAQWYSLDDTDESIVDLKPGASLEGMVELTKYFSSLEAELRKGSLIALWSYQLATADGRTSRRLSGSMRLAR